MRTTLAAATVLLSLGMTTGTAAGSAKSHGAVPVGTWSAEVVVDGTHFPTATMSFTRAGTLRITTPVSVATGTWHKTGRSSFEWQAKEVYQAGPGLPGHVLIASRAVLDGNTFTSSGKSQVYDQEGNFAKTVNTVVTATRTSTQAQPEPASDTTAETAPEAGVDAG